jgi:hypothetical protein
MTCFEEFLVPFFPDSLCRIWASTEVNDKMDGTQIPTKMPSNWFPVNQSVTENKKEIKARIKE